MWFGGLSAADAGTAHSNSNATACTRNIVSLLIRNRTLSYHDSGQIGRMGRGSFAGQRGEGDGGGRVEDRQRTKAQLAAELAGLRESERLYRQLAESTSDIVYILNGEGALTYVNQSAAACFGSSPEEPCRKAPAGPVSGPNGPAPFAADPAGV